MWNPFGKEHPASAPRLETIGHVPPIPPVPADDGAIPLSRAFRPEDDVDDQGADAAHVAGPDDDGVLHDAPACPAPPEGPVATIEIIDRVAVATILDTELCRDHGVDRLADLLLELAETGSLHFVLDVQNVQHMDSACLGCLVEALNRLSAHGGRIALVNPHHNVNYIFRLTRLDRVFTMSPDVPAALRAVARERAAG